ncbi:MAG TPA: hypothetical protein PKV27_00940 [Ilumatobacteraceae bacterium]|nr:hypothetical protein [Ilumatobacteraceae bacterium]
MSTSSGIDAYKLGRDFTIMPIAIDWAHTVEIPAGPVTFVVEARSLTQKALLDNERDRAVTDGGIGDNYADLLDGGASLHVLGADDRLEYLRFDCFDNEPHYHYIDNANQGNTIVRFDNIAEGDPLVWTVRTVGTRLAAMLDYVGNPALASAVRDRADEVDAGVQQLNHTLARAAVQAVDVMRATAPTNGATR